VLKCKAEYKFNTTWEATPGNAIGNGACDKYVAVFSMDGNYSVPDLDLQAKRQCILAPDGKSVSWGSITVACERKFLI